MAFNSTLDMASGTAMITLVGELDAAAAPLFRADIERAGKERPERLVLQLQGLTYMASAGLRALIFAKQTMGPSVDLYLVAPQEGVLETIRLTGFDKSCIIQDSWNAPAAA